MRHVHLLVVAAVVSGQVQAQVPTRSPACISANDNVTRMRLGKDRLGRAYPVDVVGAVAAGRSALVRCRSDSGFMLAYALARVDLAAESRRSTPAARTTMFEEAVADLEAIKSSVMAGRSDRYEIFNILALIYYDSRQHEKSLAVSKSATPYLPRMTAASQQKLLVTQGMAQAQMGQSKAADASFKRAQQSGHPKAAEIRQRMLGTSN